MGGEQAFLRIIGETIKSTRLIYNKNLIDTARLAGINIRVLKAIEEGRTDFEMTTFFRIHQAIGFDIVADLEKINIEKTMFKIKN
ncbi:MAG: hypothetical protein EHM45_17400 [Desulfobacteraceae bacterium]|nr:MAG: hypothetical protein EHM45_17400 [Desulfobacteraceae bacterium]